MSDLLDQSWMLDWSSSLGFRVLKDSLKFQSRITLEFFCIKFSINHSGAITQSKMPPLAHGGGSFNLLFGLVTVSVHDFFFSTFDG